MAVTIFHNPRYSKSRQTLELLRSKGVEPKIVEYLQTPPSASELDDILKKLKLEPREAMRRKEAPYKENDLADESLSRAKLIKVMVDHPILIERPIVVSGAKAAIGRPPEAVLNIL